MIPFVSESYSSSSDPPEEDIPLCTLKSFPYQPEHCVAWGRNKFDQLFNSDIKMLESCLKISFQTSSFTSIPVEKQERKKKRGKRKKNLGTMVEFKYECAECGSFY